MLETDYRVGCSSRVTDVGSEGHRGRGQPCQGRWVEGVDGETVTLRTPEGVVRAVIVSRESVARPISCGDEPEPVPSFELAA